MCLRVIIVGHCHKYCCRAIIAIFSVYFLSVAVKDMLKSPV